MSYAGHVGLRYHIATPAIELRPSDIIDRRGVFADIARHYAIAADEGVTLLRADMT